MPYKIVKDPKKGYYVMDTSGKKYSKKPLSLARAKRQLAALHIHTGHGLDNIVMPKKDFIKEHHKLLNVLKSQDPKKLKDEYNEQSKELKKVLQGGITPEEIQKLEAEYNKIADTVGRLQLYMKNREAMLNSILARDPEREQTNKIYLQNLISLNEHLIKAGNLVLRMHDIDYALGRMTQEEYELDKKTETELVNNHRMQLAAAKESLAEEEAKVKGGIAVKLNKNSDGSYSVSDMKGKVLESGLNKQEAEKALTKWYKYQPPVPTFSSEQSAFKKVKKGGITADKYSQFMKRFNSLMHNLNQETFVYPDGTIEIKKYAEGPFVDLVKAYFSETEYDLIINSKLFKDLLALESTTTINDFLDLAKRLHPGKFDGAIRSFIKDIESNTLDQKKQINEAFKMISIVMEKLYSDLTQPFIQESNAREHMTEFKAAGKIKGGITSEKYKSYLEHLIPILKNLGSTWTIYADGSVLFDDDVMEPIMAFIEAYFPPPEFELIKNSATLANLESILQTTHMNGFINLIRRLYPGRYEGPVRTFIKDFNDLSISPDEIMDESSKLIELVFFTLIKELTEQYIQDPVDLSKFRQEFKAAGNEINGSGYYQDELHRRMQRFPEHIANPIIQKHLSYLEAIGPSRANLLKGRLFGNPERQQRKENIINHAIAEAQAITEKRKRRKLPVGSTYVTSMDDIASGDEVIDYANNSRSQIYHSPADWEAWRVRRAELRQPFNDPYSNVIVNPRNIERFTAEILPEEVGYKKYREGEDIWYQAIDDKGNPIGKPSWEKPPIETFQKYRPRAPTIEVSEPDTYVAAQPAAGPAAGPIPVAPIAHPAPSPYPIPIAYPPPNAQPPPNAKLPPIPHPAPFANIVATPNPLFRGRTPNPLFKPYTASGKFSEDDMLIGDNLLVGGKVAFTEHKIFVQWLNAMFYELLTKPVSERNNLFKARTEIKSGLPTFDESKRTFIVYDRAGRYLSLKTYPIEEFDDKRRYFMNKDNEIEWGFPFIKTDYSALERDKPLDADGVWRSRTDGLDLYFTRIPTSLKYPILGTPSSSPSGSPKAKNSSSSSPKEGPGGFAPGSGPVSLVSASEMAGGPPPPIPGTEGPNARKFREHVMRILGWSEEKVKENPEYQGYLARGEGKVKFVKKYLKGQGLPATKKNVAKVCDIMNTEGIVFEATKK